jgi:NitT/TauT family transport system substrate-binding protein
MTLPTRRSIRALVHGLLICGSILGPGLIESAFAADKLTVGFPSLSMSSIMPHIAQDLGYFGQENLDVDIEHFESGSTNAKALLAHAVDLSDVETSAILAATANGADLRIIGTQEWGLHFVFYATHAINSLQDLYGKRFAISGLGGLPYVIMVALVRQAHLDPDRIEVLPIGGQEARLKALIAGKVDATVGEDNVAVDADPNLHRLFLVADKLPQYLSQAMAVYSDTLATKGAVLEKFQRALVRAARFSYSNKAAFVALAAKHLPGDAATLSHDYDFYSHVHHWSINGDVPIDRIEYVQSLGILTKIQPHPVDLKKLIDQRNIDQVLSQIGRANFP